MFGNMLFASCLCLLGITFAPLGAAADISDFFVGLSAGTSQNDLTADDFSFSDLTLPGGGIDGRGADDSDVGWKIFGGFQFHEYIGIEAAFVDLGEFRLDGIHSVGGVFPPGEPIPPGAVDLVHVDLAPQGFALAGFATWPLLDTVGLFAKAGVFIWDSDVSESRLQPVQFDFDTDDSGTDLMFGLGGDIAFSDRWAGRLEWERFQSVVVDDDADLFSLGITYRFGRSHRP